MVNKKQERKQNRREFLTSSVAGAGAGLLVLGTSQTAKGEVITQPGRGRVARNWKLKYHENFGKPLPVDSAPWVRDPLNENSPWHVDDPYRQNDAGDYFKIVGGENFERHINSFNLMRKRVPFGDDGWLTAELAARDYDKDGTPENPPSLRNVTVPHGGRAALIDEPSHDGGLLIRSTDALPRHYRIEYTLRTIEFGGMRNGDFRYDGKFNGYSTEGCKTNWPWKNGGDFSGPANMCNSNFRDVRFANGYYFLSIMDYPNPAPHNNVFIHHHRKVNMDAFNVIGGDQYDICNPAAQETYNYGGPKSTHNAINELFITPSDGRGNNFISETECGTFIQGQVDPILVSAAEIKPELMPEQTYQFAIERDETGYTMEMSGNFRFIGQATLRYHRDFIQNGYPIWHYNNTPEEYVGQFDDSFTLSGEYGSFPVNHTWPDDSAYPDYFIIGDPHLTHYEGQATVDNIRLYVPK
jgi:hypothetical protein